MRPDQVRSGMQRLPKKGPLEWLGHRAIEVSDEIEHLVPQIVKRGEIATSEQLTNQDTQPELHLVQPRRMLRRVMKDDFVRRVCQECGPCRHRLQNAALVLNSEILGDAGGFGHIPHQTFRAMRVQIVHHDVPLTGTRVAVNGAANVGQEVGFSAGGSDGWADDFASDHIEIDDE